MTEELPYTVLKNYSGFEIRRYDRHVVVQVVGRGTWESVSMAGFQPLFAYISGRNRDQKKIAMTAPVFQQAAGEQEYAVSFVMPEDVAESGAPAPFDTFVETHTIEPRVVAAIRFSGGWNAELLDKKATELLDHLRKEGIESLGEVYFARFDPPWKPGFLRRNEALVEVRDK